MVMFHEQLSLLKACNSAVYGHSGEIRYVTVVRVSKSDQAGLC